MDVDERYRVLYNEAERRLGAQATELDGIRNRASAIISAAAIATSFFGANLVRESGAAFSWLAIGAISAFVGCFLSSLWLLMWRVTGFNVGFSPGDVMRDWIDIDVPVTVDQFHRELAVHLETAANENSRRLRSRRVWLQVSAIGLMLEVVLWVADLLAKGTV